MIFAAIDSTSRIIELLAYSGAGAIVGGVGGWAARAYFHDLRRASEEAKKEAEEAQATAEEAREVAWMAKDEAHSAKA